MNEQKISPTKNIAKNELVTKNKRLFLQSLKPFNNLEPSSQYRLYNRRYFGNNNENQEEPKKLKQNININSIKTNNFFISNNTSKNSISKSQEKIEKSQKAHENNLKKLKELEKILEDLEKNNLSLSNEIDQLKNEEDKIKKDIEAKDEEEKELNTELDNLKNINEDKNREYLHLMNLNHHRQIERGNNHHNNNNPLNNNNRPRIENVNINNNSNNNIQNNNNNSERSNNGEDQMSINELLNRVLRIQRQVRGENNDEERDNNINSIQQSINNSVLEENPELGENLGPPMTFAQIDALPVEKYPKKEIYDEKCVICSFNLCYNDSVTKLQQCQHTFHKECLGNFLIRKQGSKCPICKVSLI